MACCVPLGFAAAIGAAGASPFLLRFRPWFLVLSIALIGLGFWQQRRAKQCAVKGRLIGQFLLWTAVAIVLAMILFPQQTSGVPYGPWSSRPERPAFSCARFLSAPLP
jgi:FtsH-binding integral membrane protein